MSSEERDEGMKRWKLRGRVTGAPGPLSHLVVEVVKGPVLAERETVDVLPVDAPQVLSKKEAQAIGELVAGCPSSEQEQLALSALARLENWSKEGSDRG